MGAFDDMQVGLVAGLATSVLWVLTSLFFTAGGKRIGATAVNTLRLVAAVVLHLATFWIISDVLWPAMSPRQFWALVASGLIGLTLCDQLLFTAFLYIGPRRSLLMMTTSPIWALVLGVVLMGDALEIWALVGIAMIVAGVAIVILQRRDPGLPAQPSHERVGWIFAAMAACFQATGLLFSKWGIGHGVVPVDQHLTPQEATLVRMVAGTVGMAPWLLYRWVARRKSMANRAGELPGSAASAMGGAVPAREDAIEQPGTSIAGDSRRRLVALGLLFTVCGAVVGPYLGVWFSLIAADRVPLGVAQTICSLSPVMILPVAVVFMKERAGWRGWLGAFVAVAGTAVLFMHDRILGWLGV